MASDDVLIVDDEQDIRDLVAGILSDEGFTVRTAADADSALAALRGRKPSLVILDVWLTGSRVDGLELLTIMKEIDPYIPILVISGHGTIETAVAAIRQGAYDFLEKPFTAERLLLVVERALENARLKRENSQLRVQSTKRDELIGSSSAIAQLRVAIDRLAPTNSRVLISGAPGSGKELLGRQIHERSPRASGPFVVVSAASMEPERLELELFGQEGPSGHPAKIGLFEQAHNGTLFLDEVGDMPLASQNKVLRVLVDQRFRRVHGDTDVQVSVRVIASTTRDLVKEIAAGNFREDLFHRLNVVPLRAPALAERREDIPDLISYFVGRLSEGSGLPARSFTSDAVAALQVADWPGNVRQLRNIIERILILAGGDISQPISLEMLSQANSSNDGSSSMQSTIALPLRDAREHFEREYLSVQIMRFGGNVSRTAAFIGMERSALHRKLKSLGVEPERGANEDGQ
jgi:two-component system nitrogen regulation response regulator NtrX